MADDWSGVSVLVLGATGFIGRRVVAALAGRGAAVTAAGRNVRALAALPRVRVIRTAVCDLADSDEVVRLVRQTRPAVTFNFAAYGVGPDERDHGTAHRINAVLPGELAAAIEPVPPSAWSGVALVHAGSALEYGTSGGDLREDTTPAPTTLYGRTKLAGTHAVAARAREHGLPAVTARLFTVYGPGERAGRLLPSLLETAVTGKPLPLTAGVQRRDFTYVDDVTDGLLRLARADVRTGETVNLATGHLETVRRFAERAAGVLGIDTALLEFGAVPTRAEEMSHDPVSVARLRTLVGWVPATSIEDGVLRTQEEMKRVHAKV
jgi:UDP-glucose 4-epimerase